MYKAFCNPHWPFEILNGIGIYEQLTMHNFKEFSLKSINRIRARSKPNKQPFGERLFQAWLHTRETQQFFTDYTAQYRRMRRCSRSPDGGRFRTSS
jgi:hypothetical protein